MFSEMNKLLSATVLAVAIVFILTSLVSCGPTEPPVIQVTSVSVNPVSAILDIGETAILTAIVSPSDATDKTVTWTSSNPSVVTVSNGTITTVGEGSATITATAGGKSGTCQVTVNKKVIEVSSVELDRTNVILNPGKTISIIVTIKPDDATDNNVTWESSDKNVVTVDGGNITAVQCGTATITATVGGKQVTCAVQVKESALSQVQKLLEPFYEALDGQHWKDPWIPGQTWPGLEYDETIDKVSLYFNSQGLKGSIPECIGDLGDLICGFSVLNEPGLTGTLPDSFRKLVALNTLRLNKTSMTSLPDVFGDMKELQVVDVYYNEQMSGPIPKTVGDSPDLRIIDIHGNRLTGELQASWARVGVGNFVFTDNCMTGKIPSSFLELDRAQVGLRNLLWQKEGYGFDISDIEIHGYSCWPLADNTTSATIEDLYGNLFSFDDVISKNKYTVYISWAPWCPFSKELMPQLRDYYDMYRSEGLEVLATVMITDTGDIWKDNEAQKREVQEKGYDKWYNFSWWDYSHGGRYFPFTPTAEVYDSNGYILFSSSDKFYDPVRKRFDREAATELVPFLEGLLGPAEAPDFYTSTDYSYDGKVLTLQKASVGKGINIVFMGDGYTDKDMASDGLYEKLMKQAMEEFFAIEPYKTFRDRFNVFTVKVVSPNARIGTGYSTALSAQFGNGSEVWGDYDKVESYVKNIPSISSMDNVAVAVLVNTRRHAGMTKMFSNSQSAIAFLSSNGNESDLYGPTLRHETGGHAFAFLADEYAEQNKAAPASHINDYNEAYKKYGWFSNVDFTDDPSKIKWSAFLTDSRYKDEVGIFEGGALYTTGAYRPSENSMMNMNFEYFNAPSRWAIYKRIMELSGESASFEKFLEYDAINRGKKQSSSPITRSGIKWEPTAPPVIAP